MPPAMNAYAVAEMPVFTAAILAVVGYYYRKQDKLHADRDEQLAKMDRKLTRIMAQRVSGIRQLKELAQTVRVHDVKIERLREGLAVVTAEVERNSACTVRLPSVESASDGQTRV